MRIGLISDSHIPSARKELWAEVREVFKDVELILHAGDIYDYSVLDWLEELAPVLAARGNGDDPANPDGRVKEAQTIVVEGLKIGMTHYIFFPGLSLEENMRRFFGGPVDILVFGDTHVETIEEHEGVLLVNPGSPTYPHNLQTQLGTVGLLDIKSGKAEARIISLKEL